MGTQVVKVKGPQQFQEVGTGKKGRDLRSSVTDYWEDRELRFRQGKC